MRWYLLVLILLTCSVGLPLTALAWVRSYDHRVEWQLSRSINVFADRGQLGILWVDPRLIPPSFHERQAYVHRYLWGIGYSHKLNLPIEGVEDPRTILSEYFVVVPLVYLAAIQGALAALCGALLLRHRRSRSGRGFDVLHDDE